MTRRYPSQDRHRSPPKSKSGLKGVIHQPLDSKGNPLRKPWKAYYRHHGQFVCIGYFATKEEAGRAYDAKALQIHGKGTFLNFPPQ